MSYSLLNSVLGPVMRGPSSSHTAGPYFIADTVRQLALSDGDEIINAEVIFDPNGSYARVYNNQGSDQGMAAGLIGCPMTDKNYINCLNDIKNKFDLNFVIKPLFNNHHPNDSDIVLTIKQADQSIRKEVWRSVSLGGGMFKITALNNNKISIDGAYFVTIFEATKSVDISRLYKWLEKNLNDIKSITTSEKLIQVNSYKKIKQNILDEAPDRNNFRIRNSQPVQFVIREPEALFTSCAAILDASQDKPLHLLAEEYEARQLGTDCETVRNHFSQRLDVMMRAVEESFVRSESESQMKFLQPSSAKMLHSEPARAVIGKLFNDALAAAIAVLESGTNRGIVVAAPTAGSAGIVPGILYALLKHGVSKNTCIQMLEVASLVGAIVARKATFAAEVAGCNAETGVSAAMAAAGLAHIYGATPQQAFDAASICMMNTMGLVCDPVNGEVEIPCHARNIGGISHAIGAVTAALGGFKAVIPMDELILAMMEVADKTHPNMLCTAKGGCAITPTGLSLSQKANECTRCIN